MAPFQFKLTLTQSGNHATLQYLNSARKFNIHGLLQLYLIFSPCWRRRVWQNGSEQRSKCDAGQNDACGHEEGAVPRQMLDQAGKEQKKKFSQTYLDQLQAVETAFAIGRLRISYNHFDCKESHQRLLAFLWTGCIVLSTVYELCTASCNSYTWYPQSIQFKILNTCHLTHFHLISFVSHPSVSGAMMNVPSPDPQTAIPVAKARRFSKYIETDTMAGR